MTRLICISDTHNRHGHIQIPDGDILIHAGDFTARGTAAEVADFGRWLKTLPHAHKIVICGNHDFLGEEDLSAVRKLLDCATVLQDESVDILGIKIYGSAWTPYFGGWAFNLHRGPHLAERWSQIPEDTDVLVTHGPPALIGDQVHTEGTLSIENVGCTDLSKRLSQLKNLKAHIYGHIHEGYGLRNINSVAYINASILNEYYHVKNSPIQLDI